MADRRKTPRAGSDRRSSPRRDAPWWAYVAALLGGGVILVGLFALIY